MLKLTFPFVVCMSVFSLAACAEDGKGASCRNRSRPDAQVKRYREQLAKK